MPMYARFDVSGQAHPTAVILKKRYPLHLGNENPVMVTGPDDTNMYSVYVMYS